jgi:putative transposase
MQIEQAYEIRFLEIGNDEDHVHFMIQSIPTMSITNIVQIIKSITTRQIYALHRKEITRQIWTGKLRTSWYYVNTVWAFAGEQTIRNYIKNQWFSKYQVLYEKNLKQGLVPLFPVPRS